MTKRPSPFESNISRQYKVHLNNYENDLKALRNVKEKTLKKLLDGSRKFHAIILSNKDNSKSEREINENSYFLQKYVTDYFTVNGKNKNEHGRIFINSFEAQKKCFFCEANTSSIDQCKKCLEFYCSACSFVVYESSGDKRICLSCS